MANESLRNDLDLTRYNHEFQKASGSREMVEQPDGEWIRFDEVEPFILALMELVELKGIKERLDGWEAGSTQEMAAMFEEYESRKPEAWERARLLVTPKPTADEPTEKAEYCDLLNGDCCLRKGHEGDCNDLPF